MDENRWRVRRYVVPVPKKEATARPWQLQALAPAPPARVAVWGVWPPEWDIENPPMLLFPVWHMAFRAACDRSQFKASPAPGVQRETLPPIPESAYVAPQFMDDLFRTENPFG